MNNEAGLTYLASPYSKYPHGRDAAFYEASKKAAELMLQGKKIFCPIAHSHAIETLGMKGEIKDGDFWLEQDFAVLGMCKELIVYKMQGWDTSYGVAAEIDFAHEHNIPVSYIEGEYEF